MSDTIDVAELARHYLELRNIRAKLKEDYEAQDKIYEEQVERIQNQLNEHCNEVGASSIKTEFGTVIRSVSTRYWTNDWGAMHSMIVRYEAPYLLEKRISNLALKEFLEQNPDAFPPGLNIDNKYTITVRKPSKKV